MPTIRARGDKFQAIVRIKSGGAIVHQESRVFSTQKLAKDWAERVEATIKLNGTPQRQLKIQTLGSLMLRYLDTLIGNGPIRRTRAAEIEQLATYFMRTALNEVRSVTFTEFATLRRKEGTGPTTVLHNLATVRSILNGARAMYGLNIDGSCVAEAIDVLRRMGTISRSKSRERRCSDDELNAMVVEFQRISHNPSTLIPMHTILPLMVALPRRLSEITSMCWDDLDRKQRLVKLRDTKHPTNPRDEIIPLPPKAFEIITGLPVVDQRIVPYKAESISAAFQRCCARLNIQDLHLHDLRHEGISRLFDQGLAIQEVALISGHQSWTMLRRYTHPSVTALSEKMNAGQRQAPQAVTESA